MVACPSGRDVLIAGSLEMRFPPGGKTLVWSANAYVL
jgi:hypothetical protein